jgi:thiol-disulfide isomerase/thioredoxin
MLTRAPRVKSGTWFTVILLAAVTAAQSAPPPPATRSTATASAASSPVVDADGLQRLVASYHGKVVLLDFWATWCVPCVQGLPELARLQKRFGDRRFQVIAVSFDDPKDWTKKALPVLKRAGWSGPAVVVKDRDAQNAIVKWLGRQWRSELPARYVLGTDGRIVWEVLEVNEERLPPLEKLIEESVFGATDILIQDEHPEPAPPKWPDLKPP